MSLIFYSFKVLLKPMWKDVEKQLTPGYVEINKMWKKVGNCG